MVGVEQTSNRSKGAGQLMIAILLVAIAAGAASALMFVSIVSGALISLLLLCLAPLPLMVAALGWGPLCASLGGVIAAAALAILFGSPLGVAFALAVVLPAWWLGHLALLGRPQSAAITSGGADPGLEWYPVGRLLLWIAGFATLTTAAALLTMGNDAATINNSLRSALLQFLKAVATESSARDIERLADMLAMLAPETAAIMAVMTLTLNLWLAASIAATSGRLQRPWPDLKNTALPPMTLAALSVALALCFTGGLPGLLAQIAATAMLMGYAFIGFAVLHTVTQSLNARAFWLAGAYAIVVMFSWLLLVMVALGIADAVFGFRARYLRRRPPPLPAS